MIDIRIGQLYSFYRNPRDPIISFTGPKAKSELIDAYDIVFEITKIDGFVGLTTIADNSGWFDVGKEYIAKQNDITHSGNYRLIWDPSMETVFIEDNTEYGADCPGCNKHYPHAMKAADFKCWACRNGF